MPGKMIKLKDGTLINERVYVELKRKVEEQGYIDAKHPLIDLILNGTPEEQKAYRDRENERWNNWNGHYRKYCHWCNHRIKAGEDEAFCSAYFKHCREAVYNDCIIPFAGVSMLNEDLTQIEVFPDRKRKGRKGGTVVPPSNFQFVSTQCADTQSDARKPLRPHGSARAHARKEPLAPTQKDWRKCGKEDCPYYGHLASYCIICSNRKDNHAKQLPDMCANLLFGECDGHACKCDRYVDFIDWCNNDDDEEQPEGPYEATKG